MIKFISNMENFSSLLEELSNDKFILVPIFNNYEKKYQFGLSFVYLLNIENGNKYVINRTHSDALKSKLDVLLSMMRFNEVYVYDLKSIYHLIDTTNAFDLQSVDYFLHNKVDGINIDNLIFFHSKRLKNIDNYISYIPIMKIIEITENYINVMVELVKHFERNDAFIKFSTYNSKIFNFIEKNGLQMTEDIEYCNFIPYTITSRPSNSTKMCNFMALNKKNNDRKKIFSRFYRGKLFNYDYSAYHLFLISDLIDEILPSNVNIHEYFAKEILKKDNINKKEYDRVKSNNFAVVYGKSSDVPNIPFFKKLSIYKKKLMEQYENEGYVETILFKRPLLRENLGDMGEHKLFNYIIQSYETEKNLIMMEGLIELLKDNQSTMILYNYDGFTFDIHPDEDELVEQIKNILEQDGYKCSIKHGFNLKELEDYE